MQTTLFILFWIAVGAGIYWLITKVGPKAPDDFSGNPINPEQIQKRRENLDKILGLAQTKPKISNSDVQALLGVSDPTATRYLEYLVNLGKLTRVGERGQGVYYKIS